MARSISIDDLGFRNFHKNCDSIVCKYDQIKKNRAGEKCTDKNLYANPENPNICLFLALGLYFALESVALGMKDFLFIEFGSNLGSAAKRFNTNLGKIIECYEEIVSGYINASRGNSHGIRKGSSTYAISGITLTPSLISIALRGEWSLGKVFNIYFNFGEVGNTYLDWILAGLNPNSPNFDQLPPYFTEGFKNTDVKAAIDIIYGNIPIKHPKSKPILLLGLASVVHHSLFLENIILENHGHILCNIPILQDKVLLSKLKELVSTESSPTMQPMGIPPHIHQIKLLQNMREEIISINNKFSNQASILVEAVCEAIENNDVRSSSLNLNTLNVHT